MPALPSPSPRRTLAAAAVLSITTTGCPKNKLPSIGTDTSPSTPLTATTAPIASAPEGTLPTTSNAPPGAHPRILLTPERLAAVSLLAQSHHPTWAILQRDCDEAAQTKPMESGYMGADWGNVALDLALSGKVSKRPEHTRAAIMYLKALVDDREKIGDRKGGDDAAEQDDGYAIRNRGFLAAIAYDWLHDDLSPAERAHIAGRFAKYVAWYKKDGYRKDEPWSNHFMGYFGAAAMAGIACEGDAPACAEMHRHARELWNKIIVPGYKARLAGGDYPEGWQYGRLIGAVLGLWIDAEGRAVGGGPAKMLAEFPWLKQSVTFQTHALLPDTKHMWDAADWSRKPATPFAPQLYGTAIALGPADPAARQALFMARANSRPDQPEWTWLAAVGDAPGWQADDPKKGPTSYLAPGTGTVFARTAWRPGAVWVGMNSGPWFGDHQHLDQGHFEVARGDDALVIDPGDYDSYSTTSHNAILVDDKNENLRWSPNQQAWSKAAKIARFEDAGRFVYALGDYTDAYDPDDYPQYKKTRSVSRAERELVFSRTPVGAAAESARVIIYDRITVTKPSYAVTWAGHSSVRPEQNGAVLRVAVGRSAATLTTLVPASAKALLLKEPTIRTDDMFMKNDPAEGISSTRFEVKSPAGATERRFLHAFAITGAGDAAPPAVKIDGEGCEGAALDKEAYVFTTAGPQRTAARIAYQAPSDARAHVVTGLAPGAKYAVTSAPAAGACGVTIAPGGQRTASSAGVMVIELGEACSAK